jgi:tight adherence protein C
MDALTSAAFVAGSSLVLLVFLVWSGRRARLDERLRDLSGHEEAAKKGAGVSQFLESTLPKLGAPLVPPEKERTQLATRLVHAGLYGRHALLAFLGVKMLLMTLPLGLALAAILLDLAGWRAALIAGGVLGGLGSILPSFWLDFKKAQRQTELRRALPDALDVIVICLEGGLSLPGALARVVSELHAAHPLLAAEMNIAQREIQLGLSAGEALRHFAERSDLEEVRSLASVILQTERFGASLAKALRIHAETLRTKRMLRAEEKAQKAVVKILFPTLFCIFPAMYLVILGPATIQIVAMFAQLSR